MSQPFEETKWYSYTSSTQTRRTWARRVESIEEILSEFQSAFPDYADQFPYTIYLPEDRFSISFKRNKTIICLLDDHFVLMELARNEIQIASSKYEDVSYLERGRILLYSWLAMLTPSGLLSFRFNTTHDELFAPIVEKMRDGMSAAAVAPNGVAEPDLSGFDYLRKVNVKYFNYGKRSIRPDDSVISILYQPERCLQEINLFNRNLFRRYSTDHLSVLTDQELILIKEENKTRTGKDKFYGAVFTYIPRCKIDDITFVPGPEGSLCTMEIMLPDGVHLTAEISTTNEELARFQNCLN